MHPLSSRLATQGFKGIKTDPKAKVLLTCLSVVLVTVAMAATGDPTLPSPDAGAPSAEQGGRPSSPSLDSDAREKSLPRATEGAYESDEDCE